MSATPNPYVPMVAEIVERIDEAKGIFTLRLRLRDPEQAARYSFVPGQFNMVYLYGVGEVPISIVSDPLDEHGLDHTIRAVGRVTEGLACLQAGAQVGIRGPFGRGWPVDAAQGKDVLIITGGLGCAPVVAMIEYVLRRREQFGRLVIMQGVKHSSDLIYHDKYTRWAAMPDTRVLIAANSADAVWPWHVGRVTDLFEQAQLDPARTVSMMCGPEGMMLAAADALLARGHDAGQIYLSMERNMQCAVGHCGHCQFGSRFICRDGPVFAYSEIADLMRVRGI